MPPAPDSPTDTYLDVLRTLGVTDAALRRHHDAGPERPLRVAIDADRGSPTADLLAALDATGRLLDLRDGFDSDHVDRLAATFARFGLRVECIGADGAEPLELVVTDHVTGETTSRSVEDAQSDEAALRDALPDVDGIAFAELLDGRYLVADDRDLDALAGRYGSRIQPFDDPLLAPEEAIELSDADDVGASPATPEVSSSASAESPTSASAGSPPSSPAESPSSAETISPASANAGAESSAESPTPAVDDGGESFGEFVSAVDDSAVEAVEAALADEEPDTHTIEGDGEDVAAASNATVGGGPKRTVSTSGIDDVFASMESETTDDDSSPAPTQTMFESSDPPTDATASSDDSDTTQNGLTGGPTRTVSTKSADDILEQATGDSDFEEIAEAEGDADPEAVLADADDVPPALEDSDVAAQLTPGEETTSNAGAPAAEDSTAAEGSATAADEESTAPADDSVTAAAEDSTAADDDPVTATGEDSAATADDSATAAAEDSTAADDDSATAHEEPTANAAESAAESTDAQPDASDQPEPRTEEPIAVSPDGAATTPDDDDADPDANAELAAEADRSSTGEEDGADADPATPMPAASEGGDPEPVAAGAAEASRDGESAVEAGSDAPADAGDDAGGSSAPETDTESSLPDDELLEDDVELRSGRESVERPAAPETEAVDTTPGESADADGPLAAAGGVDPADTDVGSADGDDSDDGTSGTATQSGSGAVDRSGEPAASSSDGSEIEESTESEEDPGLVGRITSTIFGR